MSEEQYKVFNDYDEMKAFMDENGGTWGSCHDSKGFSIRGSYYVKYKPKPLKKEFTGVIAPHGSDARLMADAGQNICNTHIVSGDMYNDFVGERVKITIEVINEE